MCAEAKTKGGGTPAPRTPGEHRAFISELIKLSLFFSAEFHRLHPEEDISSVIVRRTSMWEIIGLKGSEEEASSTGKLAKLHAKAASSAEFETEGFALLLPHLDRFLATNLEWDRKVLAKYDDSCFRYDPPAEGRPANHCNFHITNSISPKSILKEREYVVSRFIRLMDASERLYGFDALRTGTWLNSVPQWLDFLPAEWIDNMGEPHMDISGNLGSWGQIITARKTFNFKTGEHIRAHLEMPFKPRTSWCSFAAMKRHLKSLQP